MKILVLITDYPRPNGTHAYMFAHVRNRYYQGHGQNVTVINFACDYDYVVDGIRVITLQTYEKEAIRYDMAIAHAPNLRNHYRFLKKHESSFAHLLFFFHGQEVLYLNKSYPKPYPFIKKKFWRKGIFQDGYDFLKLRLWRAYFKELAPKADFIFVSNWLKRQFESNTGLTDADLLNHCHIINNSVGATFENAHWDPDVEKKYDFITIRSNLDGATYCIDLVTKLAIRNPEAKFLFIGKGVFFEHNILPDNAELICRTVSHEEMLRFLNVSKCGILLTRNDTQGVMTCEMAAFGIPVITSDIEVCHEFFSAMPNVAMISNGDVDTIDILSVREKLYAGIPFTKDQTYFAKNTIAKELSLIEQKCISAE